jgi:hypothetical protein
MIWERDCFECIWGEFWKWQNLPAIAPPTKTKSLKGLAVSRKELIVLRLPLRAGVAMKEAAN